MPAADDDGRPSYADVLRALRGENVTEPVPDLSLPGSPSLRDVLAAFTPAGTDPDELMAALKGARMPSVPLSQIAKANEAAEGMRWCRWCQRPEPADAPCPELADREMPLPPDPSPGDLMAGFGIADMLASMTAGGVALGSAERIIGAMLAAHGIFTAGQ